MRKHNTADAGIMQNKSTAFESLAHRLFEEGTILRSSINGPGLILYSLLPLR
jgi:hypothetical protein